MRTDQKYLNFIREFGILYLTTKKDLVGICAIDCGHTGPGCRRGANYH